MQDIFLQKFHPVHLKINIPTGFEITWCNPSNYRPVCILFNIPKIYERCIYDQIQLFFDSLLSKYQCRFRRDYSTRHCLITLIENWKKSVDNDGARGVLLIDLSKPFDDLPHELLIAKLDTYCFGKSSLKLIHSYLSNRKQRVKLNGKYSSWSKILFRVPQASVWGPLLFNTFICDMFTLLKTLILHIARTTLHHIVSIKETNFLLVI